jgi:hypothetical protein
VGSRRDNGRVSKFGGRLRHHRVVRAVGLPSYQLARRLRAGAPPRVLANGLPKSGTHLLTSLLARLPDMTYSGVHLILADRPRLARDLGRVRDGRYVSAHLPAAPGIVELLDELDYRCVFILRDPRDAVVSDVHYILGFPQHPLHRRLHEMTGMSQRLTAVITGIPGARDGLPLMEPVAARLGGYLGWLDVPGVLTVRFEDLIGARGGGDDVRQLETVRAVAAHVDRPLSDGQAHEVTEAIWSTRSSTFRRGGIGEWREHFEPAHAELMKAAAGPALIRLGYETDDCW